MCGGGGGGGGSYSQDLREQEAERERKLQQGMRELEQVFAPYYGEERVYSGPLSQNGAVIEQNDFIKQLEAALAPPPEPVEGEADPRISGRSGLTESQQNAYTGYYDAMQGTGNQNLSGAPISGGSSPGRPPGQPPSSAETDMPKAFTDAQRENLQALGLNPAQINELQGYHVGGTLEDQLKDFGAETYSDLRYGDDYYTTKDVGDPAWESVRSSYMDFANPQLQQQYGEGAEDLTYALARGGQLTGTVGADRWNDLNQQFATRKQDVASQAEGYADQRRQSIMDLEQQYRNMLTSSSDPSLADTGIDRQLTQFSTMPEFSSLGPLFQNTTAGLAAGYGGQQAYGTNQAVNNIMSGRGAYRRDPNASSGRVVR